MEIEDSGKVVARQYGLREPLDWNQDVTDELWKANCFWNQLVEIEYVNRETYRQIIASSNTLKTVSDEIATLEKQREELLTERAKKRSQARSRTKADTRAIDLQLKEIRAALKPLYTTCKELKARAREEQKPALDALETERREKVKARRQQSGLFWSNYNAVEASYKVARIKAMKDGAELRFRRFLGEGRLVNQIQGGMTVEQLFTGQHSQVRIDLSTARGRKQTGTLVITAYTGRYHDNKPFRRTVSFPIVLHRPFPEDALIKSVAVSIRKKPETQLGLFKTHTIQSRYKYSVTFTCRSKAHETTRSGPAAAGVNLGWKQVKEGLRVATTRYHDGTTAHLVLPQAWLDKMAYVRSLQQALDVAANEMHAKLCEVLKDIPAYNENIQIEGIPTVLHRQLVGLRRAKKPSARRLLDLFLKLKLQWEVEPNSVACLHDLAVEIEAWRQKNKRILLEMDNLRDKLLARRKDMYRVYAKRLIDRAGYVVMDATSYRDAATKMNAHGEDSPLFETARTNRVLASPYSLRLSIDQAAAARDAIVERRKESINHCHKCGSKNVIGDIGDVMRSCAACSTVFDVDENAAINLLCHRGEEGESLTRGAVKYHGG